MPAVVEGRQLRICDVEEVGATGQGDERVPGVDVGGHIRGVAVGDTEGDRHGPVGRHGQDPYELSQVWAMVLAETMENRWGGLAATILPVSVLVGARQLQRRRVVVQPRQVDVEALHRVQHEPGEQARPVRVEQPSEHPPDLIVVEQLHIVGGEPDHRRVVAGGPLSECVHRAVTHHQVTDHHPQRCRR